VLALLRKEHKQYVADLGTGTGAIALAIAHERPHWQITATDISTEALEVARRNAEHHHCHQIHFVQGRWCEALAGAQYDAILSNPPYLAQDDPHLIEGDVRFEPLDALVSGKNGLQDLHCIISQAVSCLKPGGWLLLEHGYNQGAAVREMMMRQGYQTIGTRIDMSGHERVSIGQMPI
jgi:release factor glutamine methyltransferase